MQQLSTYLGMVLLPICIFLLSADSVAFNQHYYESKFKEVNIYATIDAPKEVIDAQAKNILNYIQSKEALQPTLLNKKEIQHLADVQKLVKRGQQILILSCLLLIACLIRTKEKKKVILGGSSLSLVLLGVFRVSNFNTLFYNMHLLLFNNNLWLLNPAVDNLIKLYPEAIFQGIATRMVITIIVVASANIAISLYKSRRKESTW